MKELVKNFVFPNEAEHGAGMEWLLNNAGDCLVMEALAQYIRVVPPGSGKYPQCSRMTYGVVLGDGEPSTFPDPLQLSVAKVLLEGCFRHDYQAQTPIEEMCTYIHAQQGGFRMVNEKGDKIFDPEQHYHDWVRFMHRSKNPDLDRVNPDKMPLCPF